MTQLIKVLCVDDNRRWRETVGEIVGPMGYAIEFASSSRDAMYKIKRSTFHIAILDKKLDDNDPDNEEGLSIAYAIAGLDEGTKIIVYTAYGKIEDARDAFRNIKVRDFIGKDRPISDLANAVRQAAEAAIFEQTRPSRMPSEILASKGVALEHFLAGLSPASLLPSSKQNLEIFGRQVLASFRPFLPDKNNARLLTENKSNILQIRYWSKMQGAPIIAYFGEKVKMEDWLLFIASNVEARQSLGIKNKLGEFMSQETSQYFGGAVFELENVEIEEFESELKFAS